MSYYRAAHVDIDPFVPNELYKLLMRERELFLPARQIYLFVPKNCLGSLNSTRHEHVNISIAAKSKSNIFVECMRISFQHPGNGRLSEFLNIRSLTANFRLTKCVPCQYVHQCKQGEAVIILEPLNDFFMHKMCARGQIPKIVSRSHSTLENIFQLLCICITLMLLESHIRTESLNNRNICGHEILKSCTFYGRPG